MTCPAYPGGSSLKDYLKDNNIDVMANPEQANDPKIAAFILVHSMKYGTLGAAHDIPHSGSTKKRLDYAIKGDKCDLDQVRAIVNKNEVSNTVKMAKFKKAYYDILGEENKS